MLPARLTELNKHTRGSNEEVVGCAKKHAAHQGESDRPPEVRSLVSTARGSGRVIVVNADLVDDEDSPDMNSKATTEDQSGLPAHTIGFAAAPGSASCLPSSVSFISFRKSLHNQPAADQQMTDGKRESELGMLG